MSIICIINHLFHSSFFRSFLRNRRWSKSIKEHSYFQFWKFKFYRRKNSKIQRERKREKRNRIRNNLEIDLGTRNIYLCISVYSNLVSTVTNQKLFQSFCAWLQRVPTRGDSHWRKRKRAIRLSVDGWEARRARILAV